MRFANQVVLVTGASTGIGRACADHLQEQGLRVYGASRQIKDVEKALRIRLQYIEAIESGRFDLLPGAAYIPAFLRAYALHVGLDAEKVLTAYRLSGPVPIKRPIALPADFPVELTIAGRGPLESEVIAAAERERTERDAAQRRQSEERARLAAAERGRIGYLDEPVSAPDPTAFFQIGQHRVDGAASKLSERAEIGLRRVDDLFSLGQCI